MDIGRQSATNRQERGRGLARGGGRGLERWREDAARAYEHYRGRRAGDEAGRVARSRIGLPLSHYTEWYWKADLHNLLRFLALRMDARPDRDPRLCHGHRGHRRGVGALTWASFSDHRLRSVRVSGRALEMLRRSLAGATLPFEEAACPRGRGT
ncbi:MAG: FAD-dependent thymidylate synthase [Chloroflexota bacterium]